MRRREFIKSVGRAAIAWPSAARAQQPAMPMIGFLDNRSPDAMSDRLNAFRLGLKETNYFEGKNVTFLYRFGPTDQLPKLAAELVHHPVSLIVATVGPATFAAKAATATIPIVFLVGEDPVKLGLVASLARPGGNLTGINLFTAELAARRLELLRELVPKAARIAVLINPADVSTTESTLKEAEAAAQAMGMEIQVVKADTSREVSVGFETMIHQKTNAVFVASSPFFIGQRVEIVQMAAFHRLPTTYSVRDFVDIGGLMSYGPHIGEAYRQIGIYAGRILKGGKPADLPVVQPTKFELVVNARTAGMLSLTVPATLLAVADEVIE
jgi:ABC-type uncharacterized transport system substrate-binding protein